MQYKINIKPNITNINIKNKNVNIIRSIKK